MYVQADRNKGLISIVRNKVLSFEQNVKNALYWWEIKFYSSILTQISKGETAI